MNTTRRLLGFLAPYRARVTLAVILTVTASALNVPAPLLVQGLVDRIVASGSLATLPAFSLALLGVYAAQAVMAAATALTIGPVGLGMVRDLRHALYARLQKVGLSFYDRTPTGAILSRLMDDVDIVQSLVTGQTLAILSDLGTTAAISGVLLARDPRLALVVGVVMVGYAATFRAFAGRIRDGSREIRDRLDGVFGHLKERLDGALVVRAYAREEAEMADFLGRIGGAHGPRVRVGRLGAAFTNLGTTLGAIGATLVFAVGAYEALSGRGTPGGAVAAATLAGLLFGPVSRLADLANVFEQGAASVERLGEILDREPEVLEPSEPRPIGRARGRVEFDRVGFGYVPGQPVLWDVRLDIEPGMRVALVGPTGCGKSTLLNLLLRYYDPSWGEIRLDGLPLREVSTADLRRQVGVVPQESVVFAGTLAENIRFGAPDADGARVEAAARAAAIHDLAVSLPDGYATRVGEGGHALSLGEQQRLAIARAFCKDPALVVLDEATSSLDAEGEALIRESIARLLAGRTSFIVAHRLATVIDADRIVVMDGGLVVQVGTHESLMAEEDGLYRRLCARQFGEVGRGPRPRRPTRAEVRELEAVA